MKKVLKILGIIVLVVAFGLVGLYLYADNKQIYTRDIRRA